MENSPQQQFDYGNENAAVLSREQLSYGVASTTEVSLPVSPSVETWSLLEQLQYFYCEHIRGLIFIAMSLAIVFAIPVALVRPEKMRALVNRFVKRAIDIAGAITGLILSLPVFVILPILIKLDSRGPVFYTQVRVGLNYRNRERRFCQKTDVTEQRARDRRRQDAQGRLFSVVKFRTMVADAEKNSGPVWATKDDARVTRLGAFLRKSRLDEIPQFINILKGEMSLVGPRPERPSFVRDLSEKIEDYSERLEVKPGLTGLAQVENGYDTSLASVVRKVNLDRHYIRTWSLWTDIKILARTIVVVLTGRGSC